METESEAADLSLQQAITDEANARIAAISQLGSDITTVLQNEIAAVDSAIASLESNTAQNLASKANELEGKIAQAKADVLVTLNSDIGNLDNRVDQVENIANGQLNAIGIIKNEAVVARNEAMQFAEDASSYKNEAVSSASASAASALSSEFHKVGAQAAMESAQLSEVRAGQSKAAALQSEQNAKSSETLAEAFKNSAAASSTTAGEYELKAKQWSENPENSEVETGKYSAKHYSLKAEASKIAAAASETVSLNTKVEAIAAKDAAQIAQIASESARDLSISAKDTALLAKTAAQAAETNAGTHATTATNAAAAAVVTKGEVETLKTETISEKNLAIAARQGAETAETNAAESEDNAAASAAQAETLANSISLGGIFWPETEALRTRVIADEGTFIQPMRIIDPQMDNVQGVNTPLLTNMAAYKTGKLYSIRPDDASGDFICVRATTPTRINQLGESEVVPVNTPVIDWSTGSPLLIVTVEGELTLATPTSATKIVITIDGEDVEYNNIFPTLSLPVGTITKVIATVGGTEYDLLRDYLLRVDTASGTIDEQGARDLKSMYEFLDDEGLLGGLELLYLSNAGIVQRTDGLLKFVRTAFDASNEENHLNGSATASIQPRLVGGIAPNSKIAAANLNGESRYFTHPEISFEAGDAWSVTVVVNWNNDSNTVTLLCGSGTVDGIYLKSINKKFRLFTSSANTEFGNVTNLITGKNTVITFVYNTVNIIAYVNGDAFGSAVNTNTAITFNKILAFGLLDRYCNGKLSAYIIQSTALTPTQVADLHTTLRSIYPEIESTVIGTQTWASRNFEAVATPMGNVIANVTENGAVEKITNGDFENGLIGILAQLDETSTYTLNTTDPISGTQDGVLQVTSAGTNNSRPAINFPTSGRATGEYRKFSLDYKVNSGTCILKSFFRGSSTLNINVTLSGTGTFSFVYKADGTSNNLVVYFNGTNLFNVQLDNISDTELNWSNATEIYDAVYAATTGTTAQKEYAALKEAAMWCYYNNSADNGAIYGKKYNKYAKRLLNLDMLSAGFGWHIPTKAENDLMLSVVGDANKLKMTGTDYFEDDNGTNETGLTLLGSGIRRSDGEFEGLKDLTGYWLDDDQELPTTGLPIRLIKD